MSSPLWSECHSVTPLVSGARGLDPSPSRPDVDRDPILAIAQVIDPASGRYVRLAILELWRYNVR
jgi:hypothetical protein